VQIQHVFTRARFTAIRVKERSAGFQPAVSRISNPQIADNPVVLGINTACRMEFGDTAGWKPALRLGGVIHLACLLTKRRFCKSILENK
jgi:hypothetical protein